MKQSHWTVYCHTHVESGRCYVGLTKKTMAFRWNQHLQNAKKKHGKGCAHFWAAIRKYGPEAFAHDVLSICDTLEEANAAEEKHILELDTRNPENGFNLTPGGNHTPHPVKNPWDRPGFREANAGRNVHHLLTSEARAKQQVSMRSPESRAKRSGIAREQHASPETRAVRDAMRADPAYGRSISESLKASLASEEARERMAEASRSSATPEVREARGDAIRAAYQDPSVRERHRAAVTAAQNRPDLMARRRSYRASDDTKARLSAAATGRRHTPESIELQRELYLARSSSCKFCGQPIDGKRTCINGKVSCWDCKNLHDQEVRRNHVNMLDTPSKLADPLTERIVESVLKERYSVEYVRNYSIGPYSFDFFIPSINLLIECQGDFFHNFKEFGYSGTPKDRAKASYIENNTNHKLVWIWEHEIHVGRLRKILDHHIHGVTEPEVITVLNELEFRTIQNADAHQFLSEYHYLGNLGTVATCFGAFSKDILVAVCAFGGVTRNQSIKKINSFLDSAFGPGDVRELRRFCIRPNVVAKNLASYCLKRFVDAVLVRASDIKAILSFSDPTVGDRGTIYKASNWVQMGDAVASYHYIDSSTNKTIHKRTVWDMARSAHLTELQFASQTGLRPVSELPKSVWLKLTD